MPLPPAGFPNPAGRDVGGGGLLPGSTPSEMRRRIRYFGQAGASTATGSNLDALPALPE